MYKRILCIPDIQAPYHYKKTIQVLTDAKREFKPDAVFCLGDELDQYTLSKYDPEPDADSGQLEYEKAMDLWQEIYGLFPVARSVTSNHVARVAKRAIQARIPSSYMRTIHEFMQAPDGWEWRDFWDVQGIRFEHGERAGGVTGLRNLVIANMSNTVIGHQHEVPGTTFVSNGKHNLWGLNVGCLVDEHSYGLRYTKRNRHKPVLGFGVIIDNVPRFVPV